MSISLFKWMTIVRGAERVRTMGRSSAYLGPLAVSKAGRLASYEWEDGKHGITQLGRPTMATGVSPHGRTGVFGRFHSLTKQLMTIELESGWGFSPNPWVR